jgi:DNA repair exonuclease SbcCD nuclease subunit
MFKFLHAADIHLDSPLQKLDKYEGAPVEELRGATRRAFENLVELAIGEEVDFVLIAGDLYDGDWKDYNTGLFFMSQMSKLREANIPVFIIAGNHDAASKITKKLRLPETVNLFPSNKPRTICMENLEVAIHGQGFASPAVKKDLSAKYPPRIKDCFNIGLLHTCVTGRAGHEPYAPCKVEDLKSKGYDYWALGHVHKREILQEDPMIVFPGNIQGRHVRETGPKGCVLVKVDNKGRAKTYFRSLDVARWFVVETDASSSETGYEVVDSVCNHLESLMEENEGLPLVTRIEIAGESKAHNELASNLEKWTGEIRSAALDTSGGGIWVEKIKVHTHTPIDPPASGPVGELLHYIDQMSDDQDRLKDLAGVLKDLDKKLPRELKEGEEVFSLDNPVWVSEMLDQVRPMLVRRLMKKEDV